MRLLYVLVAYLLAPIVCGVMLWRGLRDRSHWENFRERFGYGPGPAVGGSIWVHAVSVGEVQAAATLVHTLRARYPAVPLVVTTVTPTGAQRARELFREGVLVRYVPYDLPGSVRRFFDRVRPRVAIILETELWPTLYHECGRRRVPLVLASARISPRSVARYRRLAGLFRETLSHGIVIAAQSEGDAARFRSIGANPARTHVTGNIKFDFALPADIAARGAALRERYAAGRAVWVAGSTHEGEEDAALDAQAMVRAAGIDALLVLVPRHPNRFAGVADRLQQRGIAFMRRSAEQGSPDGPPAAANGLRRTQGGAPGAAGGEVLLVDTLGELLAFYAAADVAFVAGSLVPIGGHNLLEPLSVGVPALTGPYVFNAEDIARLLIDRQVVISVRDARELAATVVALLEDLPRRRQLAANGLAVLEANRGALARLLLLLGPVIEGIDPIVAGREDERPTVPFPPASR
ncbi:MAG: 3-deoxy-D-manno-octulosonic acid transferase [Sinobacteraceae bacterium]|nr:3-deoxy-D-manno-octulosonic acid transferase [Nevskiaceae bacterium]